MKRSGAFSRPSSRTASGSLQARPCLLHLVPGLVAALALCIAGAARGALPEASELLPPGHWSVEATERLARLGLVPGYLPSQNLVRRAQVRAALERAVAVSVERAPAYAPLARGYLARFFEELAPLSPRDSSALQVHQRSLRLGFTASRSTPGEAPAGPVMPSAIRLPAPHSGATVDGALSATLGRHLALALSPAWSAGRPATLDTWEAVAALWNLELSVGRSAVAYGLAGGQGSLLSGSQRLTRLELRTAEPWRLPGFLRALGPLSLHTFLARAQEGRHPGDPFLWGMSLRLQPHPRLDIGLHRGVMFGGGVDPEARRVNVLRMVLALDNQSENNIASVDFRLRLPTERRLPLTLYGEWGVDDEDGASMFKAPALVGGVRAAALPGLPGLGLGIEYAFLGVICCRDLTWYAHGNQVGGWVLDGAPLGHPLGGNGRGLRGYASLAALEARLRLEAELFLRERFSTNLYAPYRPGRSFGGRLGLQWRLLPRVELGLALNLEGGRQWRTTDAAARVAYAF